MVQRMGCAARQIGSLRFPYGGAAVYLLIMRATTKLVLAAICSTLVGCDRANGVAENSGAATVTILASDAIKVIGTTGIAVLDSYGSRNGGERCANGRESWVRLFSVAKRRLTDSIPVESCLDRLVATEPPVTWHGESFTIGGKPPRRFTIVEGRARQDEERQ